MSKENPDAVTTAAIDAVAQTVGKEYADLLWSIWRLGYADGRMNATADRLRESNAVAAASQAIEIL